MDILCLAKAMYLSIVTDSQMKNASFKSKIYLSNKTSLQKKNEKEIMRNNDVSENTSHTTIRVIEEMTG